MKRLFYGFLIVFLMILPLAGLFAQDRGLSLQVKTQSGEQVAEFGEAHALVIGESAYTNGWNRLPGVKEDVTAVKRLFEEIGFHVETIQDANSRDLSSGIKNFLDNYGYNKDARLIVYFAGHGATLKLGTNSTMGYIVPVDAPLPARDETAFKRSAIAMDQFKSWATTYDARHILFIFDSCFSGTVFSSRGGALPPAINRLIAQPVRQFITAGAADEEVPDESVFRKQLEAALRYGLADANNDGYISGTELGLYLYNTVANYMNGRQNPQQGKLNDPNLDKGDFIFAVGTQNAQPATPNAPAQPVQTTSQTQPAARPETPAPNKTYKVGDIGPAGGIIFYDRGFVSDGWRYLEAAPAGTDFTAQLKASGKDVADIGTTVGSGKRNTQRIVYRLKILGENNCATQICVGMNINGYTDWFLPSKDELDLIYKNLKQKGLGGFSNEWYWSSSLVNNSAWSQRFNDGSQLNRASRSTMYLVRAVRAF